MDLLHLGVECDEDEVWYTITQRKLPMERRDHPAGGVRALCGKELAAEYTSGR